MDVDPAPARFEKDEADKLVCEYIVDTCISLRSVDSSKFRALVAYLRPGYHPPTRARLRTTLLPQQVVRVQEAMRRNMRDIEAFALTFDSVAQQLEP